MCKNENKKASLSQNKEAIGFFAELAPWRLRDCLSQI
jgi:hypothetical protein